MSPSPCEHDVTIIRISRCFEPPIILSEICVTSYSVRRAEFKVDNKKVRRTLVLELTRGLYPSGRCCAAEIPAEAAQYPVYELDFLLDNKNIRSQNIKEFKILLSDQTSSSIFQLHKFNMEGSPLEVSMQDRGYRKYRLKMFEEIHVEADPKFPCRMYQFAGEYDQCLEAEYVRQSQALLSCTPPWMTDRQEVWCPPNLQISQHTADIMELLFDSIIDGKAPVGQCLVPCITTWSDHSIPAIFFKSVLLKGIKWTKSVF